MPNGEDSDGEPSRRPDPEAPHARHLLHCFIQTTILLLISIAATPAAAQVILFPRGPSYTVPFTQGDIDDYEVLVDHDGDVVDPGAVLLSVTPVQGTGFVVTPRSGVTTAEFVSVFPLATRLRNNISRLAAVVRKSDSHVHRTFKFAFVFDASAQFHASPSARHTQLWTKAVNVYEGDSAPAALGFSWTVVGDGRKTWGLGASARRIRCEVLSVMQGALSNPAPDNSSLFEFGRSPSDTTSGEASVQFRSAPDFENPPAAIGAGNVYHVRIYNSHDLRRIGGEGSPTGCTGTALDLVVTVRDVGAPAHVEGVSAEKSGNTLTLSWDATATDVNGAPFADLPAAKQVARYDYRYRAVGATDWTEGNTTDTSVDITVPETPYELQVRAVNAEGIGAWSEVVGAGPPAGPPLNLAAAADDGRVTLTWEAPSSTGGFGIQRYEYRVDGAGEWMSTGTDRRAEVTGLTNGQEYRFEVRALTAAGEGEAATVTATPEASTRPPSAPGNLSASPGDGRVTLSWGAPSSDGGSTITDYEYRVDGAGDWNSAGTDLTEVVIGLTNGQEYRFEVRAVNTAGDGEAATVDATPAVTVRRPSAPRNLGASPGDGRVTLSWEAPSSDGGSSITDYEYQVDGAGDWNSAGMDLTEVVIGLTNGQEYSFEVRGVNAAGDGEVATATATPEAVTRPPSAPRNLGASPGDGRVTLRWERPSSDGGSAITDYEFRVNGAEAWKSAGADLREVVTGLTNGRQHTFEVRAVNAAGEGPPATAAATPVAPIFPPSAPRNLRVHPERGRVTLTWEAPSSSGGATIADYECRMVHGNWISTGGELREVVTDLPTGREHHFEVRAVNAAGRGPVASIRFRLNAAPAFPQAEYAFDLPENLAGSRQGVELGRATSEDPDGDALEHALVSGDTTRFAVHEQDGALTYIGPGEDFEAEPGEYVLTVRARDPEGAEARAHVVVTVTAVNEPPTARDDQARTEEDTTVVVDVLDNDTDPDGDSLHVDTLSVPEHGAVQIVDGGVSYTPEADFHGADRFTYAVSDGNGLTSTASVDVTVLAVNDAPEPVVAIPNQTLDEGGNAATLELAGFFDDPDGDVLTYRATSSDTAVARVTVTGALLTVAAVQSGTATVTVSAEDRDGLTATQAFDVGVSDQLVQPVVGDTLAAMGRGHLASARMTLERRARTAGSGPSRVTVMGRELPLGGTVAPGNFGAALPGGQDSVDGGWDDVLRSSSFQLGVHTGDNDEAGGGRAWTVWGHGDTQTFRGARDARSGYEGGVTTGYLGVDTQLTDRWLAGVAVARSSGGGDWRAGSSRGQLGTTLTTVQPYARWSDGTTSVWTMAGGGRGTAENVRESTGSGESSGLGLALGLVEMRRRMGSVAGGIRLGLRGDLAWARLSTDAGGQTVDGVRAAVHQMRVGVELSRPFRMQNGLVLTPFGELHARRDGGAGQTGAGLEVAAGFSARRGLVLVEAQGRLLAPHSADSYRERGASVTLSIGEGVRRPGLSMSLSPRWGAAASGTDALWQEQIHRRSAAAEADDERALDARIDYGVSMPGGRLLTPFGAYGQSQFDRRLRFGAQLGTLEDSGNEPLRIELSVQRHMRPGNLTFHQFDILGVVNLHH